MKRIVISICLILMIFAGNQVMAQDKIKEKNDKTKIKEGDAGYKEKDKDDKTKIKEGDAGYKEKDKDNKIKIKDENGKMKIKNPGAMNTMGYPYTAGYSSNFIMGNPAHAKMVLDVWKDWDDNMLDRHNFMADTIVVFTPDGNVVKGKDSAMVMWKKFRSGLTATSSTVDAWMPLRSTDKNENWVAIWGTESDTYADGKIDKYDVQEIWRINKDGKADYYKQYTSKSAARQ